MMALRRSKTAETVIPTSRKGKDRSQTNGYKSRANIANGQHRTSKISHKRNFAIAILSEFRNLRLFQCLALIANFRRKQFVPVHCVIAYKSLPLGGTEPVDQLKRKI